MDSGSLSQGGLWKKKFFIQQISNFFVIYRIFLFFPSNLLMTIFSHVHQNPKKFKMTYFTFTPTSFTSAQAPPTEPDLGAAYPLNPSIQPLYQSDSNLCGAVSS